MADELDESEVSDLEDEYTLLGELGRGGSAVVYRARDRTLFRDVAIKVVRPKFAASAEDAIARLAREARTVARLTHPNIVTVHAVKRLRDGGLALVMQLVPGRTLKQAVADDGPFPPERAERVLKDVADALAFAHAHGVVHRDVKPENIFIETGTGRALLSDFGIAYSSEFDSRLTMTGAAIGTPAYMSPEQIDGAPANARSDLYSLGLVAWEMLTGERPWEGDALYNVIFKQKNEDLPAIDELRPGEVPPRLQYIVERMLQKKPAARWAGADGVLAALNNWIVPSDWPQWEESHRRRREALKTKERARPAPKDQSADATVRFARPVEGVVPSPAHSPAIVSVGTPMASTALDDVEDDAPSWATATPKASRKWLWATVGVFAVLISSGAFAMYAKREGLFNTQVAPATTLTDNGAVEVAVVAPDTSVAPVATLADSMSLRAQRESLFVDSLRRESMSALQRTMDSIRVDSMTTAAMARAQRSVALQESAVPRAATGAAASASAEGTLRADAVRATDDAPVVAAGGRHSCSLVSGTVFCWGANDRGQLGDGELESRGAAAPIVGDLAFSQITTGREHTCGLSRGGEAFCWGADDKGQLGDATTTSRSAPVRVAGSFSFRVLRAGSSHTCGLTAGGEAACWGDNANGQLGDGSTQMRSSPGVVAGGVRFVSLSAGWNHSCGIASDGAAWCWGANSSAQLGNGTRTDARTPVQVAGGIRFTSISAGNTHTCAVSDASEVYCWGRNGFGQLGVGGTSDQVTPSKVDGSTRFNSVSVGSVHSCARTRSGQGWCWGRNVYGQIGDGTNVNREVPTRVIGGAVFAALNATAAHTCGTATDGETTCWGFNVEGQLGDGTRVHRARPTRVSFPGR